MCARITASWIVTRALVSRRDASLPAFSDAVVDDDQTGERISPPPVRGGVQQADQDSAGQARIDQGDATITAQQLAVEAWRIEYYTYRHHAPSAHSRLPKRALPDRVAPSAGCPSYDGISD